MNVVDFFLNKVERTAKVPWVRPLHQYLEDPRDGPEMEIHLVERCASLAYFPCGNLVAAAFDKEIQVVNVQYGTIVKTFFGHSTVVSEVAVSPDDLWIISGAGAEIRVWAKRTGLQIGKTLAAARFAGITIHPIRTALYCEGWRKDSIFLPLLGALRRRGSCIRGSENLTQFRMRTSSHSETTEVS